MAELFGVNTQGNIQTLTNSFSEGELDRTSTCSKMEHVVDDEATQKQLPVLFDVSVSNNQRLLKPFQGPGTR